MERYAQIKNGIVDNVIESSIDPDGINSNWVACGNAGPGWLYANGVFTAPVDDAPTYKSWPAFDFYRRFTPEERIAIRELAKTDPVAEDFYATLNAAIASGANVRDDDTDTIDGLAYLESVGAIQAGRALELLDTPVQPHERPL